MTLTKYNVPKEVEKKILTAIELKKELERYESEIKEELTLAMIQNDIYSIDNPKYKVTLATRNNFKAETIPRGFEKKTLDTAKVSAYEKLNGELPKGVAKTQTKYITWRTR